MIKINLLPRTLVVVRQRNVAIAVVTLLIAAEVAVLIFARQGPLAQKADYETRKAAAERELQELQGIKSTADGVLAEESKIAPKYDFINNMMKYNKEYPSLYRQLAGYTYRDVTFLNLSATANSLTFDAYVSNPADVSRLLLGLSRNPDIQGLPVISGVPGWDEAEQAQRRAAERQTEASDNTPGSSVIGGAVIDGGFGGGAPGMEGGGGGNGPGGGMSGMPGMPMGGGGGGGNGPGGPPGMSMPSSSGALGTAGFGSGGGGGGNGPGGEMGGPGGGGGGGGGGGLDKFKVDQARRKLRGFTVTVTCQLNRTIARPGYGTADQQAGAGGGGGGGGMSGMPGMGFGGPGGGGNGP
jgi:hypothetical protein